MNEETFRAARRKVLSEQTSAGGIGTLSEKTLHRILKLAEEPDEELHEVKFLGSVADVCRTDEIIEVQTSSYSRLAPKLEKFLAHRRVTVICPLDVNKTVRWLNPKTGEISAPRKSPAHRTVYDMGRELYAIHGWFLHEGFTLRTVLLDTEEYRFLDGWDASHKRGSTRMERIPNRLLEVRDYHGAGFRKLIPDGLPKRFTAKEFCGAIRVGARLGHTWLKIFVDLGMIVRAGKNGRAFLYETVESEESDCL